MSGFPGSSTSAVPQPRETASLVPTGQHADHPPISLPGPCLLVGTAKGVDLQLGVGGIAPVHALIVCAAEGVFIRNFADAATILINGQPLHEQLICDGDQLQIGQFTCRFAANQTAYVPPEGLPVWAFDLDRRLVPPPPGRTVLIGRGERCDLRLQGGDVSGYHVVLFAADGAWHLRDLVSAGGVLVDGEAVLHHRLSGGEGVRIGSHQMRYLGIAKGGSSGAGARRQSGVAVMESEAFLGGMPMTLPELALPKGFGQVQVSFGEPKIAPNTARAVAAPRPGEVEAPVADGFISVNQGLPSPEVAAAPSAEIAAGAMSPVPRTFAAVPKMRSPLRPRKPQEDEVELDSVEEEMRLNDAPFGGAPLGGADVYFAEESAEQMDLLSTEVEHFADDVFWNQRDGSGEAGEGADIRLPQRLHDMSPDIPEMPPTNGKPVAPVMGAPLVKAAARDHRQAPILASPAAMPAAAPMGGRRRSRSQKVLLLKSLMAGCMVAAAAGIELGVPVHTKLEGRLTYLNTPAPGTAQWADFESDQRRRMADPSLDQAALASLSVDHPATSAGFLGGDGRGLAAIVSGARFDGGKLVLAYTGKDQTADIQRIAAVLKAIYQSDSDLMAAAADARKALADWEPRVASRRQEMSELSRRMNQQQKIIDAAKGMAEQLGSMQAAAKAAGQTYTAALNKIESDQAQLNLISARLSAVAMSAGAAHAVATRPVAMAKAATRTASAKQPASAKQAVAATQPVANDLELDELQRQINDVSEQISALEGAGADSDVTQRRAAQAAARKALDAALAAAEKVFVDHPDLRASIANAAQLQTQVDDLITQLAAGRAARDKLRDMQRLIEQTDRRRQRIIEDLDPRMSALRGELDVSQRKLAGAEARVNVLVAQTQPATKPTELAQQNQADAQHAVDEILHSMLMRQEQLTKDDTARLRDRVSRLIDDASAQLTDERQLVVDTLGTLQGRLQATVIPGGLSTDDTRALSNVVHDVEVLAQAQQDYATAFADADSATQSLASYQEQLGELNQRAADHREVLTATAPRNAAQRQRLMAARDDLVVRLGDDRAAMETSRTRFNATALNDAVQGLTVAAARQAQQVLAGLVEARDAKLGDIAAMERSRNDLAQALSTTVDLKRPTESDVAILSDDSNLKLIYMAGVLLSIWGIFAWLIRRTRRPSSSTPSLSKSAGLTGA